MGAPVSAPFGTCDMLPTTIGEEPMVAASNEFRPVLESYSAGRLYRRPVSPDVSDHVPVILAIPDRPVDFVSGADICDGLCAAVGHEDRRVSAYAIGTGVAASPIRIDRVAEWNV